MLLAAAIFLVTLTLVIWQPRGLGIGWSAMGGAAVALAAGVVHLSDIGTVWDIVGNATGTFVAVIIVSLVLDEAGTFEWAALHVARWGRGNGRLLFTLIVVLGALVAALFANDGAALILTPIVFQMLVALKFSTKASFAFVMATGFIADTTSVPLTVSNLVNIVHADYFGIGFTRYALVMVPVGLVSLAASLLMLHLFFRRSIPARYAVADLATPASAIHDHLTFRAGWVVLGLLLLGYFVLDPMGVPTAAISGVCALAIVLIGARLPRWAYGRAITSAGPALSETPDDSRHRSADGRIRVGGILRTAPWQVVVFSLGMYLVVYGMGQQGLAETIGSLFSTMADHGTASTAGGVGFLVAGLSSVLNNMPTVLVSAMGIDAAGATGLSHQLMVYSSVIGADLGPKITPIGSLATLLWLHVLDRKGMHISWGTYFRIGIVLTLPVLAATLLGLVGWLAVVGG